MLSKELVLKNVTINLQTTQKVYDIEVDDDHCYYANGILVSNSDAWRYMALAERKGSKSTMTKEKLKEMRQKSKYGDVPKFHFENPQDLKYFS